MRETKEQKMERAKKMLYNANHIVCFMGIGAAMECGAVNLLCQEEAYRIEDLYHYSPEEIYSTGFYSARTDFFYKFYKNEILSLDTKPNESYFAIKQLENWGKLRACITRNIFGLPSKAGIQNVIELNGNIYQNYCTKCGEIYPLEYVQNSKEVPRCEKCKAAIRPSVRLDGEKIRNNVMTAAANACQDADLLMVLGTNLHDPSVMEILQDFQGENLLVISKKEHYSDEKALLAINDEVKNVLPKIIW